MADDELKWPTSLNWDLCGNDYWYRYRRSLIEEERWDELDALFGTGRPWPVLDIGVVRGPDHLYCAQNNLQIFAEEWLSVILPPKEADAN